MSIARDIMNRQLVALTPLMTGTALDIGGEPEQVMPDFPRPPIDWKYLNLDARHAPDYIGSAEDVPAPDKTFDTVLMLEVLEHVENPEKALDEVFRILKPGGRLIMSMPFMYRHHRNPIDLVRWTHEKLFIEIEQKRGLRIEVFQPRGGWLAVVFNDLTLGLTSFVPGSFFGARLLSFIGRCLSYVITRSFPLWTKWDAFLSDTDKTKSFFHRFTIGYILVARKPLTDETFAPRECPDILRRPLNPPLP